MINSEKVDKLVFIVVNAKTEDKKRWERDKHAAAPGVMDVVMTVMTAPMDNYSFETVELLQKTFDEMMKDAKALADCKGILHDQCPNATFPGGSLHDVKFYPIVVSFDGIPNEADRQFFKDLPTTFSLPSSTVDRLRDVAGELLNGSTTYNQLVQDMQ
jgi:NTE family protein